MDLQVYGMRNVMEQAMTLIAVDAMSGGTATVNHGNVGHLVGADAGMNPAASIKTAEAKAISSEETLPLADVATNKNRRSAMNGWQKPPVMSAG